MRTLVAGCGYVGRRFAEAAARQGDTVSVLRRSATTPPEGCRAVRADLTDPATLADLPEVDAVVFAPTPDVRDEAGYARTYVEGARCLARALSDRSSGARWVHVSSTSVFEVDDGRCVDEKTETPGRGFRAARLLESERVPADLGFATTALRLGGIYGPTRDGVIRRVRAGTAVVRPRYTNRIHRNDAAAIIDHVLGLDAPPPILIGVDRAPVLEAEVLDWVASTLGVAAPRREGEGDPGGKRCSSDQLVGSGFAFAYPSFREGYAALIEAQERLA